MITLIGLGPGDASSISLGAKQALEAASEQYRAGTGILYLRTEQHPVVEEIRQWGLSFLTFDDLYQTASDFHIVYERIAETVLANACKQRPSEDAAYNVAYAVPGHPLFAEQSVAAIRSRAEKAGIEVIIVGSGSFVEPVLTAVGADLGEGCDVRDALTLPIADAVDRDGRRIPGRPDTARNLLLYQVFDTRSASHAKLALMQDYPDDWTVSLVRWAGVSGREQVRHIPLYLLDREPVDHLTSVFVPALPSGLRRSRFPELVGLMARLRAPDGCPWDREQTPQTLRRYLIEETYEAIEAIDADDPELLCEELGDVLLQVVFHAQLAAERCDFNIDDVTQGIVDKLVRRHPHVFGDVDVEDSAEVLRNWEKIKKNENQAEPHRRRDSILDGIPKGLPALMQAMEVSKRVVKVGFEWPSLQEVLAKVEEETVELRAELDASRVNPQRVLEELGDLLFTVVQIARWNHIDPEESLRSMVARFEKRFRYMEKRAEETGLGLKERSAKELDDLWEDAKQQSF